MSPLSVSGREGLSAISARAWRSRREAFSSETSRRKLAMMDRSVLRSSSQVVHGAAQCQVARCIPVLGLGGCKREQFGPCKRATRKARSSGLVASRCLESDSIGASTNFARKPRAHLRPTPSLQTGRAQAVLAAVVVTPAQDLLGRSTPRVTTWIRNAFSLTPAKQAPAVACSSTIIPRLHQSEAALTAPTMLSGAE